MKINISAMFYETVPRNQQNKDEWLNYRSEQPAEKLSSKKQAKNRDSELLGHKNIFIMYFIQNILNLLI